MMFLRVPDWGNSRHHKAILELRGPHAFRSIFIWLDLYYNVVIDRGRIRKRKKKPSRRFRDRFGHTPLSIEEGIPWKCRRLVIGTGTGALPVMEEVKREAQQRKIDLAILRTP